MKHDLSNSYVTPNGGIFPIKRKTAPEDAAVINICCETLTVEKPVAPYTLTDAQRNVIAQFVGRFISGKKDDKDPAIYAQLPNGGSDIAFGPVANCGDQIFRIDHPGCNYSASSLEAMNLALGKFMGLKPKKPNTTGNNGGQSNNGNGNNGGQSNGGSNNGNGNGSGNGQSNGGSGNGNGNGSGNGQSNGGSGNGNGNGSGNGQSNGGSNNGSGNGNGNNGGQSNGGSNNGSGNGNGNGSGNGQSNGGSGNGNGNGSGNGQSNGGSNNGSGNGNGNNGGQSGNQGTKPDYSKWNDSNRDTNIDSLFAKYGVPGYGAKK